ncbi:MAG: histidine kinase, partial [Candidatus Melainabacteria bacterium HGW-Melainabacteria-1]
MAESAARKTLLAIDDDPGILELLSVLLRPVPITFLSTCDPYEGLRMASEHQPALILLDNHMPGLLGVEVLQRLRQLPATAHIPVIMMTADNRLDTL